MLDYSTCVHLSSPANSSVIIFAAITARAETFLKRVGGEEIILYFGCCVYQIFTGHDLFA
jgi:hypothetical protein